MSDALERRYEDELTFIRRLAVEFARDRPKIADRLFFDRETGASEDPHVERLIEAFAFLTARVRLKLDDDFPELTDALLSVLYPHYLAPVPSMSIVEFVLDPEQGKLTTGFTIPRGSQLFAREIKGTRCRFRTAYPVTLWPLEVAAASYETAPFGEGLVAPAASADCPAVLRIGLRTTGGIPFSELSLDRLRFFLSGDDSTVRTLYELIFNHTTQVVVRSARGQAVRVLAARECLRPVGFKPDEGLLPYTERSFPGYRLLTEYFSFPSKFLFADLHLPLPGPLPADRELELVFFLNRSVSGLESRVRTESFRLGCAPIVNLFEQLADPIHVSQAKHDYHVVPDVRSPAAMEVYSIDAVESINLNTGETQQYQPFYSFQHGSELRTQRSYWYARRRQGVRVGDAGTEVDLSLVDLDFNPSVPAVDVLSVRVTCTNRDLPIELRTAGGENWEFQFEEQAPLRRISPVVLPTSPARLPLADSRWRLISHLALNHLSITGGSDGAEALREILRLYDYGDGSAQRSAGSERGKVHAQHIAGILSVKSNRVVAPINDGVGQGFCRGVEVVIEFDEEKYAGSGMYLFASVLEQFLGMYTSLNSATRLVARSRQRGGVVKQWPFRAGDRILL